MPLNAEKKLSTRTLCRAMSSVWLRMIASPRGMESRIPLQRDTDYKKSGIFARARQLRAAATCRGKLRLLRANRWDVVDDVRPSAFILPRQFHQRPHETAGAAGVAGRALMLGPGRAGDIKVRPRHVADELLQ